MKSCAGGRYIEARNVSGRIEYKKNSLLLAIPTDGFVQRHDPEERYLNGSPSFDKRAICRR